MLTKSFRIYLVIVLLLFFSWFCINLFYTSWKQWTSQSIISDGFKDFQQTGGGMVGILPGTSKDDSKNKSGTPLKPVSTHQLTILSWNIDGLNKKNVKRTIYITDSLNTLTPDIIMLQGVVNATLDILKTHCVAYRFTTYKSRSYYNIIMTKKDPSIQQNNERILYFKGSVMGRSLLSQELKIHGIPFLFLTSHLESLPAYHVERKKQMLQSFDTMRKYFGKHNLIFAGDMNINDNEIKDVGGLPAETLDAWEKCGSDERTKYTWDLTINHNYPYDKNNPRERFDRMFYNSMKAKGFKCSRFEFVGTKRIEEHGLFPSAHFGILVTLSIL